MRYRLVVAYIGGPFHGWQRQRGKSSVQGELEAALSRMTRGLTARVVGAGRTDAGVHAVGQVAHVDLPLTIPPASLLRGLNATLPPEIRVRQAGPVPDSFHARKSARAKLYTYRARWRPPVLPWLGQRTATVPKVKDRDAIMHGLSLLVGFRDMASFTVAAYPEGSTDRWLMRTGASWSRDGVDLDFLGEGFLRYQVRRMVGALLEVGSGRRTLDDLRQLLAAPRPGSRITTAPARGLTLERVYYRLPAGLEDDSPARRAGRRPRLEAAGMVDSPPQGRGDGAG